MMSAMELRQIVYLSTQMCANLEREVEAILRSAHRNNMNANVTGLLACIENDFFQVLEGPQDAVGRIFQKISMDDRHSNLIVLFDQMIRRRNFCDWSMAWTELPADCSLAGKIKGLAALTDDLDRSTEMDDSIRILLLTVIQNNLRPRGTLA